MNKPKFSLNEAFTTEQEKALTKLKRLKINKYRNHYNANEFKSAFDAVWYSVLHECDLIEEGEDNYLTATQLQTTKNWLKQYKHLTIEFKENI